MARTTEQQITDKQFSNFLPKYNNGLFKIGNKKKAIEVLRNLGYDNYEDFSDMMQKERPFIFRIGSVYYIKDC